VLLRPFNTYGPRQSARAVIPTIATQLLAGAKRLKLGSLHPTRDFSYVLDTVQGFIGALDCEAAIGEVVNIGSGFEISIGDAARLIAEIIGSKVEIETDAARIRPSASEVDRLLADTSRAQKLFSWQPRYGGDAGFRRGVSETVAWLREPANLARYKPDLYNI
jgi:dTDP-glucose 4,6-dehydratase